MAQSFYLYDNWGENFVRYTEIKTKKCADDGWERGCEIHFDRNIYECEVAGAFQRVCATFNVIWEN